MIYRTYKSKYGLAIAVADKEILGKKLKFNDTEFFVNPRFYGDKEASKEELVPLIRKAVNINLVGEKAVKAGKEAGMIDDKNTIMIGKVPHAQAVKIIL